MELVSLYKYLSIDSILLASVGGKPSLLQLQSLQDENGFEVRVIQEIASEWYEVAVALGIKSSAINIISTDCRGHCVRGCTKMMSDWIDSQQEVTWEHLIDALHRAGYDALAKDIKCLCDGDT